MLRIDGYFFYQLGNNLKPLEEFEDSALVKINYYAKVSLLYLESFLDDNSVSTAFLKNAGNTVVQTLKEMVDISSTEQLGSFCVISHHISNHNRR